MHRLREDVLDYLGETLERGPRDELIPPVHWRMLGQRAVVGLCLVAFSAVFFIGAITVIGWIF